MGNLDIRFIKNPKVILLHNNSQHDTESSYTLCSSRFQILSCFSHSAQSSGRLQWHKLVNSVTSFIASNDFGFVFDVTRYRHSGLHLNVMLIIGIVMYVAIKVQNSIITGRSIAKALSAILYF